MPFPDFTSATTFPGFADIPAAPSSPGSPPSPPPTAPSSPYYLLAQVKDNMTITKPTLVLTDAAGSPFALVFEGLGMADLDLRGRGFRKGATAVIPRAAKVVPAEEGKRAFVRVDKADADGVRAIPGPLERVVALGRGLAGGEGGPGEGACGACGEGGEGLARCTGCGGVRYCGRACQTKGWNEGGHKGDCKVLKAMLEIWPADPA